LGFGFTQGDVMCAIRCCDVLLRSVGGYASFPQSGGKKINNQRQ
jgi:hypothetical protein